MFGSKMIQKLILIFALARGLTCSSTANDLTFTSPSSPVDAFEASNNELSNSILEAFSPMFGSLWQYTTETISSYELYLTSLIFRIEFFFAAIGEHALPAKATETTPEDDARHHVTAMATVELMKSLRFMDRLGAVIENVTMEAARQFVRTPRTGRPAHVHAHRMFESVDEKLENDIDFQRVKRKFAQQYSVRPSDTNNFHSHSRLNANPISKMHSIIQDSQFLQLKLHTAFLRKSKTRFDAIFPNEFDKFTLANALLRLATDTYYESKVQKLYDSAVYGVLKSINPWYRMIEATDALFAALQQAVEADIELKSAVDMVRKTVPVSVKDIGKYELDFLL